MFSYVFHCNALTQDQCQQKVYSSNLYIPELDKSTRSSSTSCEQVELMTGLGQRFDWCLVLYRWIKRTTADDRKRESTKQSSLPHSCSRSREDDAVMVPETEQARHRRKKHKRSCRMCSSKMNIKLIILEGSTLNGHYFGAWALIMRSFGLTRGLPNIRTAWGVL